MASLKPKHLLPHGVISVLKSGRHLGLIALSPLDYVSLAMNGKRDFPPIHLRKYVGRLRSFEESGTEFGVYLRLLAGLRPEDRFLDMGCGCGLMAHYLGDYLGEKGGYDGLDIYKPAVRWCQKHITPRHPNFRFVHADIRNPAYNPRGTSGADDFTFPFGAGEFDVSLVKSVFTHMRPPEVENYIKEMSRVLRPGGRCLATFFLLNPEQAALAKEEKNILNFVFGEGVWRYAFEHSPEIAVAFEEGYVRELVEKHGMRIKAPYYGNWSGRRDGLSYQDMLVLEKV